MTDAAKALRAAERGDWHGPAVETLLVLLAELRSRAADPSTKTVEIIGAVRALSEALTTSRALLPPSEG